VQDCVDLRNRDGPQEAVAGDVDLEQLTRHGAQWATAKLGTYWASAVSDGRAHGVLPR
jgi:hypothetical protein